ncbi:transcriptional regulator, TetR family [Ruminococcaceae bacterium YRB3002]|nr:transcriptional regulator, TetR family [Ruminococcaceae bacterium YRB3002]
MRVYFGCICDIIIKTTTLSFLFWKKVLTLPKVNDDYLQGKRDEIINAAFEVCRRKPAYDVTMSDIVAETGMSQGGVYKYYNNICSVYAALIDRANLKGDQIKRINGIMASSDAPETKLLELFKVAEQFFTDMLISYNKILFELGTYFIQNPETGTIVNGQTKATPVFPYLAHSVSELIVTEAGTGYFKPVVPVEDILSFIISSFDGIIRDVTLNKCYEQTSEDVSVFDEKKMIRCLYLSTLTLLGR